MMRSQLRFLGTGVAMAALAAMTVVELPAGGGKTSGPGFPFDPEKLRELIVDVQSGEAEEQAEENAEDVGLVPMATPCIMRRPRLALGVDQAWRHRFAAATIATDPAQRVLMLEELFASATDDLSRWRIDVALIENAIRIGALDDAAQYLERAASRTVPETCRGDEAYFASALAERAHEAALHLDIALEHDPSFWAAHEALALYAADGTGNDPQSCEADAVRTIESIVQLGALARRDTQFQRINRALAAMPANGRTALLSGMILRQTGEPEAAAEAYLQGLASVGASPCDAILREALGGMLASLDENE